jgi:hypothetical protein
MCLSRSSETPRIGDNNVFCRVNRANPLRVNPDSIFFRDLDQRESDSIDVWVMNAVKVPIQYDFIFRAIARSRWFQTSSS